MRCLLFSLLLLCGNLAAQTKTVRLLHADDIFFDKKVADAQRLVGNVRLDYEGTLFSCDSAWLYANQDFDAFGNIRMNKGGEYTLTGQSLFFSKADQTARMRKSVQLRDNEMTLTSDFLNYDLDSETATYFGGGRIVSNRNKNVLVSREGSYHVPSDVLRFRTGVQLTNPEYTVRCDTLHYHNRTEVAYFFGPTTITSEDTRIYCENGWYDTRRDVCQFHENAEVISKTTVLRGDSIYYNGKQGYGEVFRNVSIRDTTSSYTITGHYGRHDEHTKHSLVTVDPLMTQVFDDDSLFLRADTLYSLPDSAGRNIIRAFHHVRVYKSDLQGLADSLTWSEGDSTLELFTRPVLWNAGNQITGDSIRIRMWDGHIDRLIVRGNSFIASASDTSTTGEVYYNQIKGRNTTGYFRDNALYKVVVNGNGQLVYFPTDEKEGTVRTIGHNSGECSDIEIGIEDNQIRRIKLLVEPNSLFSPMHLAPKDGFLLEGFEWREGRPGPGGRSGE